ncbi:hypothetical protein LINPERHAP2_LOCUS40694 [Linum perenne]
MGGNKWAVEHHDGGHQVESGLVGGNKWAAEHHDGGHHIQITNIKFNGSNYLRWSQSVRAYLRGRRKLGYITGAKKEPEEDDAAYEAWDSDNGTIITWLVNSMTEEIGAQYLGYQSAKEVWDNVALVFSDEDNQSQYYELSYFNALKGIWLDLDTFHDYEWESTRDANHYRSMVNKDQVFKFLSGLNDDLDEVRGRIIAQKPLPKLGEAFSEVRREETRRRLMLGKKSAPLVAEGSALQVATQVIKPATETIPEALAARRGNFQKP